MITSRSTKSGDNGTQAAVIVVAVIVGAIVLGVFVSTCLCLGRRKGANVQDDVGKPLGPAIPLQARPTHHGGSDEGPLPTYTLRIDNHHNGDSPASHAVENPDYSAQVHLKLKELRVLTEDEPPNGYPPGSNEYNEIVRLRLEISRLVEGEVAEERVSPSDAAPRPDTTMKMAGPSPNPFHARLQEVQTLLAHIDVLKDLRSVHSSRTAAGDQTEALDNAIVKLQRRVEELCREEQDEDPRSRVGRATLGTRGRDDDSGSDADPGTGSKPGAVGDNGAGSSRPSPRAQDEAPPPYERGL